MSETTYEKALRYLAEGRVKVERVDPATGLVVARATGSDETTYRLGYDPDARQWRCTCPARRECAHLTALQLVTSAAARSGT